MTDAIIKNTQLTLRIDGTATNGTDYETLPTTITVSPARWTGAALLLSPIADSLAEGMETVTVTILGADNPCVHVGAFNSATIRIADGGVPPPAVVGVASRKVHGAAGAFDLALALSTPANQAPTIEPRSGPSHQLVFAYDKLLESATAAITEGVATAVSSIVGSTVVVDLTGVDDGQYVTVELTDVASADGGSNGIGAARLGFLVGDVNASGTVSLADVALVDAILSKAVDVTTYLKDVNASGTLTLADKGITNANLTKALPPP
jgi:hypothetical protein